MKKLIKFDNKKVLHNIVKITTIFMFVVFGLLVYSCSQKTNSLSPKQSLNNIVTQSQALFVAGKINLSTNESTGMKSSIKTRKVKSIDEVKDHDGAPLFYITNDDSTGFAIISGDNRIRPVLAFSDKHTFKMDQKMLKQTGLGYWVDATENGIRKIRKQNLKQSAKMKALWEKQLGLKNLPPDTYGTTATATLMKDIGLPSGVNMAYGCSESSASANAITPALRNTFGYSSAQLVNYAGTSNFDEFDPTNGGQIENFYSGSHVVININP